MLAIRFNRVGKRNRAHFRVVVQEHTIAPGGNHIEILGSYDPHKKVSVLKAERVKYWIEKGAQVSDTAWNLFVKEGIIEGKKRAVKMPKKAVEPASAKATADKPVEASIEASKKASKEEVAKEEKKEEQPIDKVDKK